MKKAIIVGATSGIGRQLAEKLIAENWSIAITGRRLDLLNEIKQKSNDRILIQEHDIRALDDSGEKMEFLFKALGKVDMVIVAAGMLELNQNLDLVKEDNMIQTNVLGVAKVYEFVFSKFKVQGYGHLVGISSIASIRGNRNFPAYSASKAFQANYLESLRCIIKNQKLNIKITDIQPGFVDTKMAIGDFVFWVVPLEKAANQIYSAIKQQKKKAYVSKRWKLIAWGMKIAPNWILEKV